MSSLPRRIQRRNLRKNDKFEPKPQAVKHLPCGGVIALHPTRGWKRTCGARVKLKMAQAAALTRLFVS